LRNRSSSPPSNSKIKPPTYPISDSPFESLNNYVNKSAQGKWTLFAWDVVYSQVAKVNIFRINITYNDYNISIPTLLGTAPTQLVRENFTFLIETHLGMFLNFILNNLTLKVFSLFLIKKK